ncbi:helix-turn-helix domain-containing protein [Streptomyces sp. NPDC006691]|uniref:helix-turn-helix domain-containing protein n=1 Tax=Streptomyces sp. NPDC006691 TaxID=3364757 RepID=UPI00367C39FA
MSTLRHLVELPHLAMDFADPANRLAHGDRGVVGVHFTARLPAGDGTDLADCLVITPAEPMRDLTMARADRLLRGLKEQRAAGLAMAVQGDSGSDVPVAVRQAARRLALPLLVTGAGAAEWPVVDRDLARSWQRQAKRRVDRISGFLGRLPGRLGQPGVQCRLVAGLADALGAYALFMEAEAGEGGRGRWSESPGEVPSAYRYTAREAARSGDTARGAHLRNGLHVMRVPVGREASAGALVVVAGTSFDEASRMLVEHTAKLLALVPDAQQAQRIGDSAREVRLGVFHMLMGGQVALAQRVLEGLAPGMLQTEKARVYVISGPPTERDRTASLLESALEDRALLVRCPARDDDIIVVDPLHDPEQAPDGVAQILRDRVAALPDLAMGGSRPHPLAEVAEGYGEASNALTAVRHGFERVGMFDGSPQLAPLLGEGAHRWAERVLGPLLDIPYATRDELITTVRMTLEFSHTEAARILGAHRNTVAARAARVAEILGRGPEPLDLKDVRVRAVLQLALSLLHSWNPAPVPPLPGDSLAAILRCPAAHAWARSLLKPLHDDPRGLVDTVRVWVECNLNVDETAAVLGVAPMTVRKRLRRAETLVQRDLTRGLAGAHAVVLALAIATGTPELPPLC